ncbi:phosphoserine phosphatase SerB [Brevibacterium salitolerans]|uniref:phosphoserine phosphatase n=1 Tax=Brevibacterium salitolerans TaxID=1403566 RepID=A0ABN2WG59_9MICO
MTSPRTGTAGLLVSDVDSTFIDQEVIELLARSTGREAEVAAVTERAMAGELDFAASLRARVAVLRGVPVTEVEAAARAVTLTHGARELVAAAHAADWTVALVSGGFTAVIERFTQGLGITEIWANGLGVDEAAGVLTGEVAGTIVDRPAKAARLREIAQRLGIDLRRTVGVGDGANDRDLLRTAAVGVAFCAKPALREHADLIVDERDLMQVWEGAQRLLAERGRLQPHARAQTKSRSTAGSP